MVCVPKVKLSVTIYIMGYACKSVHANMHIMHLIISLVKKHTYTYDCMTNTWI